MDKNRLALSRQLSETRSGQTREFFEEARALVRGRTDTPFFAEYWLGIPINSFQRRLFAIIDQNDREGKFIQIICPTANQVGKTLADAIIQIKWNFYKKGSLALDGDTFEKTFYQTLNLSPISRQTKICMQYAEQILTNSFSWEQDGKRYVNKCRIKHFIKGKNENLGRLEFANNSAAHFVATSEDQGANIQGAQFGMIAYDECVLSLHLKEELPSKIFSRLAKYGNMLILIASPKAEERNNSQQYFFHLFQEAKRERNDFVPVVGILDENIFIPEKQREMVKKRLASLDPNAYREVVFGEFVSSATRMISPEAIESMWTGKETPDEPRTDRKHIIVADWGFSEQGDKTVFGVFDYTDHPFEYQLRYGYTERGGDPWKLMALLHLLKAQWNARLLMDVNALGGVAMKKMLHELQPMGFQSNGESKVRALADLILLLTEPRENGIAKVGRIKSYYIPELEEELASYQVKDDKIEQDWVMVLAMFANFVKRRLTREGANIGNLSMKARYNSLRSPAGESRRRIMENDD